MDRRLAPHRRQLDQAAVWADQARHAAQAPYPAAGRIAGTCASPGLHRDRPRRPLRQPGGRRVRALAQPDRHPHHLGGDGRRPGQEPGRACRRRSRSSAKRCPSGCGASTRTMARSSSTSICGTTARPRRSSSLGAGPTRRTTTPTSSRRTGRTCASSWATCATTARPRAGRDPRPLPPGAAAVAEPVLALGQAAAAKSASAPASGAATTPPAPRWSGCSPARSSDPSSRPTCRAADRLDPFALARGDHPPARTTSTRSPTRATQPSTLATPRPVHAAGAQTVQHQAQPLPHLLTLTRSVTSQTAR